jgi:hypothetical protein
MFGRVLPRVEVALDNPSYELRVVHEQRRPSRATMHEPSQALTQRGDRDVVAHLQLKPVALPRAVRAVAGRRSGARAGGG